MTKYLFVLLLLAGTAFGQSDIYWGSMDTTGGTTSSIDSCYANIHSTHQWEAGSADTVKYVRAYARSNDGGDNDSLVVAIFEIVGQTVGNRVWIDTIPFHGTGVSLDSVSADNFVLTEGTFYCLGFGELGYVKIYNALDDSASVNQGLAMPTTWAEERKVVSAYAVDAAVDTSDGGASATVHLRKVHGRKAHF